MNSNERIRKILGIVLGNNILILQGKLKSEEEIRLIGDTMAMIGHVKDFKGIELATIVKEIKRNPKKIELLLSK